MKNCSKTNLNEKDLSKISGGIYYTPHNGQVDLYKDENAKLPFATLSEKSCGGFEKTFTLAGKIALALCGGNFAEVRLRLPVTIKK